MSFKLRKIIAMLLVISCFAMLVPAFADEASEVETEQAEEVQIESADTEAVEETAEESGEKAALVDEEAVAEIIRSVLSDMNISESLVGVGYCLTATDETVFVNGDMWCCPASIYKLPLVMRAVNLKLTDETEFIEQYYGRNAVDTAAHQILLYSNNTYGYALVQCFGGWVEAHKDALDLVGWSEDDVPQNFFVNGIGAFSARFIVDILRELYYNPDKYPGVVDLMLKAQPGEYIQKGVKDYPVAQKYGALNEEGVYVNHIAGIVYTDVPFILVIMTKNMSNFYAQKFIAAVSEKLVEYTNSLDCSEYITDSVENAEGDGALGDTSMQYGEDLQSKK